MAISPERQQLAGNWKQFKGRLKEAWGDLTDDELDQFEGKRDRLEGYLQEKTGEKREALRDRLDRYSRDAKYRW